MSSESIPPPTAGIMLAKVPVSLVGQYAVLRPVNAADLTLFYEWRIDTRDLHLWAASRQLPSLDEFKAEFQALYLANRTLVIARKRDAANAGFVQAYSINLDQGWLFLLVYIGREFRAPFVSLESAFMFVKYLWESYPIRKIYAEAFEYNWQSARLLTRFGFREEGRFSQHVWYRDRYWAMIRFALYREDWPAAERSLGAAFRRRAR